MDMQSRKKNARFRFTVDRKNFTPPAPSSLPIRKSSEFNKNQATRGWSRVGVCDLAPGGSPWVPAGLARTLKGAA